MIDYLLNLANLNLAHLQAPNVQQTTLLEMQQLQQQQQPGDGHGGPMNQPNTPDLLMHRRQVSEDTLSGPSSVTKL